MPDPSSSDAVVTIIKIGFVVIPLLMVFAIIRATIYGVRRRKVLRDAGLDPMMAPVQMEARLANSALLTPVNPVAKSIEERLAELESPHARGAISAEELHEAQAKILAS